METTVDQLHIGDKIIFAMGSHLIFAIVLREPTFKMYSNWTGRAIYKNILCSCHLIEEQRSSLNGKRTWTVKLYGLTFRDHNSKKYFNLTDKKIWKI